MLEHDLNDLFPRFILRDKNGYAMAKALNAALDYFIQRVSYGISLINDVDTMPEWRLDELAWELDCIYDYTATVERKREWIKNALPYSYNTGTPKAIKNYLRGYFGEITVMEGAPFGLEPYHFKVVMNGTATAEELAWAEKAIEKSKNLRSVSDSYAMGVYDIVRAGDRLTNIAQKKFPSGEYKAGQIPGNEEEEE